MRSVVDANYLADPALEQYLSDPSNSVVLTEFAGMEAFKGDPLKNISASMRILARFPRQVIILKGTRQIVCENQAPDSPDTSRLIDVDQTEGSADFCRSVELARAGDPGAIAAVREHGDRSSREMVRLELDARKTADGIVAMAVAFSPKYLAILRRRQKIPPDMVDSMVRDVLTLSALLIRDHPDIRTVPTGKQLLNTFVFRYALCYHLLVLDWLEKGGLNKARTDRLSNDLTDMTYGAYATFYDGLLTNDAKLKRVYQTACFFLQHFFP